MGTLVGVMDDLGRPLAGGAKLSIDVLPVCAQGGGKKSTDPSRLTDKECTELLARLELRMAQLSGHV